MLQKYCYKSLSEMETTQPLEMKFDGVSAFAW